MEENFSNWIKNNFYPSSVVFATPKATSIIAKNNLTPSEFLRPFGLFDEVYFTSSVGSNSIIKNFRMDFYDSYDYQKPNRKNLQTIIDNLLLNSNVSPNWNLDEVQSKSLYEIIKSKHKDLSFPWFTEYEKTFLEYSKFNEFELYQQPLAYIYMCSIDDPIETIIPKREKNSTPPLIFEGIYETQMPILILILNDITDVNHGKITVNKSRYINGFKEKFKKHYLLYWEINLNDPTTTPINDDIWKPYLHRVDIYLGKRDLKAKRGEYISRSERIRFKNTLLDFMNKYATTLLKEMLKSIENELNSNKKGIKNTIFGFIKGNDKVQYNLTLHIPILTPFEMKEYLYAMIQFYFRNYDLAYEAIKYFLSDIKPRSLKHYNSAYEFKAILYSLMNSCSNDFEDVFKKYEKSGQMIQAFRVVLLYLKCSEKIFPLDKLTPFLLDAMKRIPHSQTRNERKQLLNHELVISRLQPLLLEKISLYYLFGKKKSIRKFILFIVLSGMSFNAEKNEYKKYCLNAYGLVYSFINERNFSFVILKEFLNRQMGMICQDIKYYVGGLKFFKNCVEFEKYTSKNNKTSYDYMLNNLKLIIEEEKKGNILGSYNVNNLSIPEVDNTSLLVVEEQDSKILEEKGATATWMKFSKFTTVPPKKIYINLTQEDKIALRNLDNIIENKQNFSNFYSKRNFNGNVNNKMIVRFTMENPLNFALFVSNMKLICDFTPLNTEPQDSDIEYQTLTFIIDSHSSKHIEIYCKPLVPGHCIIKGVEIILDTIAVIKHYFNKKNVSRSYNYRTKHKTSNPNNNSRKGSSNSQNNNMQSNKNTNQSIYNPSFNRKAEIVFDIIDNSADILVDFPMGKLFNVYKNEFLFMPIKIKNNSNTKIKRFCFFFQEEEKGVSNSIWSNKCVLCDYIYKEMELVNITEENETQTEKTNEAITYVPIVPRNEGELFIKILVKFEEENQMKTAECKRYIIKLNVIKSVDFNINEQVINFDRIEENDIKYRISEFTLDTIVHIQNKKLLRELKIGNIVYAGKDFKREDSSDRGWEIFNLDDSEKQYHQFKYINKSEYNEKSLSLFFGKFSTSFKKKSKEIKEVLTSVNLDFIPKKISNDISHSYIKTKIAKLLTNNLIIFTWSCLENKTNKVINGIYFHSIKLKNPKVEVQFLKQLMKNICTINAKQTPIDSNNTLVELNLSLDKKILGEITSITRCELYIREDYNSDLIWCGLKRYKLVNKKVTLKDESLRIEMKFTCICKRKGKNDLNRIEMIVYFKDPKTEPIIINNVPYPVIIDIQ